MSILEDIVTALTGIASHANPRSSDPATVVDNVYPDTVDEDIDFPFVVVRRTHFEDLMTLQGPEGTKNSVYAFECWAPRKTDAISLRDAVGAAMEASSITNFFRVPNDEEEAFEPETDKYREVISYSFWHS